MKLLVILFKGLKLNSIQLIKKREKKVYLIKYQEENIKQRLL